ncbi:hypothetical protein F5B18DRAFT_620818 [Nemania serpens]|nr:hypothetical protein F5B18DRAFT_620818 [Nemania serpens]
MFRLSRRLRPLFVKIAVVVSLIRVLYQINRNLYAFISLIHTKGEGSISSQLDISMGRSSPFRGMGDSLQLTRLPSTP